MAEPAIAVQIYYKLRILQML